MATSRSTDRALRAAWRLSHRDSAEDTTMPCRSPHADGSLEDRMARLEAPVEDCPPGPRGRFSLKGR